MTAPLRIVFPQDSASSAPTAAQPGVEGTAADSQEPGQEEQKPPGLFGMMLPFILIFVVFWVLLIGPDRKNRKRRAAMIAQLKKGDDVLTTGGIFGRVTTVEEERVTVQIADGVRVKMSRAAIQAVLGADEPERTRKG